MPDWVFQIIGPAAGAAGVYAAIRADLAALHVKADSAKAAADEAKNAAGEAHRRIDHFNDRRASA